MKKALISAISLVLSAVMLASCNTNPPVDTSASENRTDATEQVTGEIEDKETESAESAAEETSADTETEKTEDVYAVPEGEYASLIYTSNSRKSVFNTTPYTRKERSSHVPYCFNGVPSPAKSRVKKCNYWLKYFLYTVPYSLE